MAWGARNLIFTQVSTAETIGDVTMSCKYSKLETEGPDFESRVQGGLLADGVNSFLACLFTSPPNTTFSQNNGVISLTQCASVGCVEIKFTRLRRFAGHPSHWLISTQLAVRGLLVRLLAHPFRCLRETGRGVHVDPHLRGRWPRAPVFRERVRLGDVHRH